MFFILQCGLDWWRRRWNYEAQKMRIWQKIGKISFSEIWKRNFFWNSFVLSRDRTFSPQIRESTFCVNDQWCICTIQVYKTSSSVKEKYAGYTNKPPDREKNWQNMLLIIRQIILNYFYILHLYCIDMAQI